MAETQATPPPAFGLISNKDRRHLLGTPGYELKKLNITTRKLCYTGHKTKKQQLTRLLVLKKFKQIGTKYE
jgi:hypothetical protein